MSDYIKRESAKEVLLYNWDESCSSAIEDLERIPAEDVMIVTHGKWESEVIRKPFVQVLYKCSKCNIWLIESVIFAPIVELEWRDKK